MNNASKTSATIRWLVLLLVLAGILIGVKWASVRKQSSSKTESLPVAAVTNTATARTTLPANSPSGFQLRPFRATKESAAHQWTSEDGRNTNVIRQIAHNELEYQRMVDENSRILRRQLVYRNETAAAVMEHAKASGEAVKQLTLPGLDGQEIKFDISRADLEPSKLVGTFSGQIPGRVNSMVTLAYKFGRESFTIISPDDGIYLQGWPREPGEVIVTSFDPDKYQAMPGGEPIRTTNTFKIAQ